MNEQEAKEYQQYLLSQGFTPDEANQYMQENGLSVRAPKNQENEMGVLDYGKKALSGVASALDYAGGLTRTGAAALADPFVDQDLVTAKEFFRAAKGQAPSTAEYMERAGVPQGATVDLNPFMEGETSVRDAAGFVGDVALDPLTYLSAGSSALAKRGFQKSANALSKADKVLNMPGEAIAKTGEKIYKSGLKGIDQVAARYGKEPVSDILMKKGVTGSMTSIQKQMDEIADQSLASRNQILQQATDTGVQVPMKDAMAPTIAEIQRIRATRDPKLQSLADQLEAQVNEYLALDPRYAYTEINVVPGKQEIVDLPVRSTYVPEFRKIESITPPSQELIELPVQANYDAYTSTYTPMKPQVGIVDIPGQVNYGEVSPEQFIQNPAVKAFIETPGFIEPGRTFDYVPGPSPMQASGYKTTLGASIPDSAYRDRELLDAYTRSNKVAQGGMRSAVEDTVGRSLGQDARQKLIEENDVLGRMLTTREKALAEATKEQNKNMFTSIDGIIAGTGGVNPVAGAAVMAGKKAADVGKTTWARTNAGKALRDLGRLDLTDPVLRQVYIDQMSEEQQTPYYLMQNQGR